MFIDHLKMESFIKDMLIRAGFKVKIADDVARGLIHTSLRGVDTHGIRLLPHYIEAIEKGRINNKPKYKFQKTSSSSGIFDADHTLGYAAGISAMKHAIKLANESGVGFVAVKNSSHCGALSYFSNEAVKKGMIGIGFTHATSRMMAPGSNVEFFGTNPMCVSAPMSDGDSFCYDSAPSLIPFHKVIHHKETNEPLPDGAAADANGIETTNPQLATQLLPIASYMGFGLAMIADIFSGLLTGMPVARKISKMYGDLSEKRYLGQFFCAVRIDIFVDLKEFITRLDNLAHEIRNLPNTNDNLQNMIPGDKEKYTRISRVQDGIPVSRNEFLKLETLSRKYKINFEILKNDSDKQ